ncbi:MAG: hypothetical protein EOO73_29445 [Myxococcales bacterium]|nr:MAG: hypothetical protein EOO73_29445 [Myxococcales bacterium]
MSENKGKPSQQKADERKERETNTSPSAARTVHRLDRSRGDEKGGKGDSVKSRATAAKAEVRRRPGG